MSMHFRKNGKSFVPKYSKPGEDGYRVKQSFKDQCDINKIFEKIRRGEAASHLERYGEVYGDFTNVPDLLTAHHLVQKGEAIFQRLPAEIRREFDYDMSKFFDFVNDSANKDRLPDLLPELAKAGDYLPRVARNALNMASYEEKSESYVPPAPKAQASASGASSQSPGSGGTGKPPDPPEGSEGGS